MGDVYNHNCYLKKDCVNPSFNENTISGVSAGPMVSKPCKVLMAMKAGAECGAKGFLAGGVLGTAAGAATGTVHGTVEARQEKDQIRVYVKAGHKVESEMLI